jgi:hypothetical protein
MAASFEHDNKSSVSWKERKFLIRCATIGFSEKILLRKVGYINNAAHEVSL